MRSFLFTTVTILCSYLSFCQSAIPALPDGEMFKKIIPPSPTASALGNFGNLNVGFFTGTTSVSIPITNFSIRNIEVPISLSYNNTSGVKVEEIAGPAGLGWSLNAGGVITCQVNDKPDLDVNGFVSQGCGPFPDHELHPTRYLNYSFNGDVWGVIQEDPLFNPLDSVFVKCALGSGMGLQPDVFFYSFFGRSGKFFFDHTGVAHTIPRSNLKINLINPSTGFVITDEKGNKYYFKAVETNVVTTQSFGSTTGLPTSVTYNKSFYLIRAENIYGDWVNLEYNSTNYSYDNQVSYTRYFNGAYIPMGQNENCGNWVTGCADKTDEYVKSQNNVQGAKSIARIYTSRGNDVKFEYVGAAGRRLDMPMMPTLTSIKVKMSEANESTFDLSYQFFNLDTSLNPFNVGQIPADDRYKLKLVSVYERGKKPYSFEYYNENDLPSRFSEAQDHWGYYNYNGTRFPKEIATGFWDGGSKEVNPAYAVNGLLKKVIYPTGGATTLEYESNDYFVQNGILNHPVDVFVSYYNSDGTNGNNIPIDLNNASSYFLRYRYNCTDPTTYNPASDFHVKLTDSSGSILLDLAGIKNGWIIFPTTLLPGHYNLQIIKAGVYDEGFVQLHFASENTQVFTGNRLAGGMRLRRTIDESLTSPPVVRNFVYKDDDGKSTGILLYEPQYSYALDLVTYMTVCAAGTLGCRRTVYAQTMRSTYPLASAQGNSVGYKKVYVYTSNDKTKSGYSVYHYSFPEDYKPYHSSLFTQPTSLDHMRGLLLAEEHFRYTDNGYQLVKKVENEYELNFTSPAKPLVLQGGEADGPYAAVTGTGEVQQIGYNIRLVRPEGVLRQSYMYPNLGVLGAKYNVEAFRLVSNWQYLKQSTETIFSQNGTVAMINQTKYSYNNVNHLQPTEVVSKNSKGETIHMRFRYAADFPKVGFAATLCNNNMLESPIEKIVLREDNIGKMQIVAAELVRYSILRPEVAALMHLGISAPIDQTSFTPANVTAGGDISYDTKYFNDKANIIYDDAGNIIQYTSSDGLVTSIIWGYNKRYPVAQITGLQYSSAISLSGLDMNIINNPPDDGSLRNELSKLRNISGGILVASCTYKNLVGVSSETDTAGKTIYYEYDQCNRLRCVKDKDGNILKVFSYEYQANQ